MFKSTSKFQQRNARAKAGIFKLGSKKQKVYRTKRASESKAQLRQSSLLRQNKAEGVVRALHQACEIARDWTVRKKLRVLPLLQHLNQKVEAVRPDLPSDAAQRAEECRVFIEQIKESHQTRIRENALRDANKVNVNTGIRT